MVVQHLSDYEIQEFLDGTLKLRPVYAKLHLESCYICQTRLSDYGKVAIEIAGDIVPELSVGFADRVVGVVAKESPQKSESVWGSLSAIAASVAAGIAVFYFSVGLSPFERLYTALQGTKLQLIEAVAGPMKSLTYGYESVLPVLIFSGLLLTLFGLLDHYLILARTKRINSCCL